MGAPQNCWGPQIAGSFSDCREPADFWKPLKIAGAPQIAGGPQIAGYFPMYSGSSGGDEILVSYIDLIVCSRLIGTNAINTCTFWIVKFVIVS